ncbi:hypothetical protein F4825DRAFT_216880 [Nemania diffusa]|nr:hypothetical protein F4825DRAFT_216880 [Nemania diffusa]
MSLLVVSTLLCWFLVITMCTFRYHPPTYLPMSFSASKIIICYLILPHCDGRSSSACLFSQCRHALPPEKTAQYLCCGWSKYDVVYCIRWANSCAATPGSDAHYIYRPKEDLSPMRPGGFC